MSAQENMHGQHFHTPIANPFKYSPTITYVILESQGSELCLNMVGRFFCISLNQR